MLTTVLAAISILCSIVGTGVGLGMMVLVLAQAPGKTINRLLAVYLFYIAGWALTALLFRLTAEPIMVELTAVFYIPNAFLLYLVSACYLGLLRNRLVLALTLVLAGGYFIGVPILVAQGAFFTSANPAGFGGAMFQLTPLVRRVGLVSIGLVLVTSYLLWSARKTKGSGLLAPALLAPVGILSLLLPVSLPIPMAVAAVTSVLLSRAILHHNLFNPLLEVTRTLTASEKHYRLLSEEMTRKEQLYRTLARNLPNTTVGLFDRDMRCLVFEGQPLLMRGIRIDHSVEGKLLAEALPPEIQPGMVELYEAAFAGREVQMQRVFDGRDFHVHALPVSDERGDSFAGMIVLQDITDIREAERQTMALTLENERNQILRRFIADATHDLMTPISGMQLSIDLLQRDLRDHPSARRIDSLNGYVHRLTVLLQDMLEATSLDETDSLELLEQDVNSLVGGAVMRLTDTIIEHHHQIVMRCDPLPPLKVDGIMLSRVFINLLKNAIAYTPEGGTITVSTSVEDEEIVICVADTGVGIQASELEKIFERFYRVDKSRSMELGGAGLGLSIARRIVDLHGGQLLASSEVGIGSRFRVHLPLPEPVLEPAALQQPA